jgi:UDP-N-acetylmuramyl tripeptide synthase
MNGCARFNVANAMAAVALATAIDLPADAIAAGLRDFRSDPESNPGRGNVFQLEGVTAIVDFAHNPHGLKAFLEMANAMPAQRRLITLGMAGDRSDESIRDFVRTAWSARPDRVILKEMEIHLRGRELGVVPDLMADELRRIGVPENRIARASTEVEATRLALAWAEPGDLLLLSVLAERDQVIELLGGMVRRGWRPGQVVPN